MANTYLLKLIGYGINDAILFGCGYGNGNGHGGGSDGDIRLYEFSENGEMGYKIIR